MPVLTSPLRVWELFLASGSVMNLSLVLLENPAWFLLIPGVFCKFLEFANGWRQVQLACPPHHLRVWQLFPTHHTQLVRFDMPFKHLSKYRALSLQPKHFMHSPDSSVASLLNLQMHTMRHCSVSRHYCCSGLCATIINCASFIICLITIKCTWFYACKPSEYCNE